MTITDWKYWKSKWDDERIHSKALEGMVRRAKEERDAAKASIVSLKALTRAAYDERDAIRRKIYERCASLLDVAPVHWTPEECAAALRRLIQTDDGKTETGK